MYVQYPPPVGWPPAPNGFNQGGGPFAFAPPMQAGAGAVGSGYFPPMQQRQYSRNGGFGGDGPPMNLFQQQPPPRDAYAAQMAGMPPNFGCGQDGGFFQQRQFEGFQPGGAASAGFQPPQQPLMAGQGCQGQSQKPANWAGGAIPPVAPAVPPLAAPTGPTAAAPPAAAAPPPGEPDPDDDPNRLPTFVKVRGLPAEHDPRIARRPKPKKRAAGVCCA
mmetsp:Transcript_26630/g.58493  ORF Transcript_26630/g.58493 Transcript_26630/m.58493 type:complete len:218 (+) Transcript_26630:91-744(+)